MQCCVISSEEPFEIFVAKSYLNKLSEMENGYKNADCSIRYMLSILIPLYILRIYINIYQQSFKLVIDKITCSWCTILLASSGTLKMNHVINEKKMTYPADIIQKQNQSRDKEHWDGFTQLCTSSFKTSIVMNKYITAQVPITYNKNTSYVWRHL